MRDSVTISQRDLRFNSRAIMDAVEAGHSFTVTRDGRPMGELVPLRRRFVTRAQFTQSSANASVPDLELLRRDTDEQLITGPDDPYAR